MNGQGDALPVCVVYGMMVSVLLDVLVDLEDILSVDVAIVVDITVRLRAFLHITVDGQYVLGIDDAVTVHIGIKGLWCGETDPSKAVSTGEVVPVGAGRGVDIADDASAIDEEFVVRIKNGVVDGTTQNCRSRIVEGLECSEDKWVLECE